MSSRSSYQEGEDTCLSFLRSLLVSHFFSSLLVSPGVFWDFINCVFSPCSISAVNKILLLPGDPLLHTPPSYVLHSKDGYTTLAQAESAQMIGLCLLLVLMFICFLFFLFFFLLHQSFPLSTQIHSVYRQSIDGAHVFSSCGTPFSGMSHRS